jgi:hypothetical protein
MAAARTICIVAGLIIVTVAEIPGPIRVHANGLVSFIGAIITMFGCYLWAKLKNRSSLWGFIGLLTYIAPIILWRLKDKSKDKEITVDICSNQGVACQTKGESKKALENFKLARKNVNDHEDVEVVEQKMRVAKEDTMGLFGKNKVDYCQAALSMYLGNIYKAAENQFEYSLWYSWGMGATAVFEGLKKILGCEMTPDSLDKAKHLLEAGIQPMISLWYHNWESQENHSSKEKERVRKISLANVQTLLSISSEDSIKLYLGLDKQLKLSLKGSEPYYYVDYVGLFYQRCRECITGEQIVDWTKLNFPIESSVQVLGACHAGKYQDFKNPALDPIQAFVVITKAGAFMMDEFKRVHKKGNKELYL